MEVATEHDGDRKNLLQSAINPGLGTQLSLHTRLFTTSPSLTLVVIDHNYGDDSARSLGATRILEEDFLRGSGKAD